MPNDDVARRQPGMRVACAILALPVDAAIPTATCKREAPDMFTHQRPRSFVLLRFCPRIDEIPHLLLVGLGQGMNDPHQVAECARVMIWPAQGEVEGSEAELMGFTAGIWLANARRIAAPTRTMVVVPDRRVGVPLIETNAPAGGRETARDGLQCPLPIFERGSRLRHPPAVDGLEAVVRRIRPVVGDLPFRELCQDQGDPDQLVRLPSQAFQCPQQPRAGTAAPEKPAASGLHQSVDLRLRLLEVLLENAKELLRGGFGIEGEVTLLGEEFVRFQRCQQLADQQVNRCLDIDSDPLAKQGVAMNGKEDEGFTDAFAQGTREFTLLAVQGRERFLVIGKLESWVGL